MLNNIFILLLKNILADYFVQEMNLVVNPWHSCNKYKHVVLFAWKLCQDQDKCQILCGSKLKICSHHYTELVLMPQSIFKNHLLFCFFSIIHYLYIIFLIIQFISSYYWLSYLLFVLEQPTLPAILEASIKIYLHCSKN